MRTHGNDNTQAGRDVNIQTHPSVVLPARQSPDLSVNRHHVIALQMIQIFLLVCIATMCLANWERTSNLANMLHQTAQEVNSNATLLNVIQARR